MTDRARELLERALELSEAAFFLGQENLSEEIRAYLADPEVKRGPLDEEDIIEAFDSSDACGIMDNFIAGVRFAEKHHGIGEE